MRFFIVFIVKKLDIRLRAIIKIKITPNNY